MTESIFIGYYVKSGTSSLSLFLCVMFFEMALVSVLIPIKPAIPPLLSGLIGDISYFLLTAGFKVSKLTAYDDL